MASHSAANSSRTGPSPSPSSEEAKDKRVVLFGKTGEGKSTVANVLVTGGLSPVVFESSDAARGCTSEIKRESGRGWYVIDTVGLGEAEMGNTSHADAKEQIVKFLKEFKKSYSHIIYVQKARRITTMEELIWKLFAKIFEGAEGAFVVLITAATPAWYQENRSKFPAYWENVEILFTDIPPINRKRPVLEKRLSAKRAEAIKKLEEDLDRLFEKRGRKYFIPDIATMNEQQLEEKSWSLLDYIVTQIKRLFDKDSWATVAAQLSTVIKVSGIILDVILLAGAVRDKPRPLPVNRSNNSTSDLGLSERGGETSRP